MRMGEKMVGWSQWREKARDVEEQVDGEWQTGLLTVLD
jgi:hypothetical protein